MMRQRAKAPYRLKLPGGFPAPACFFREEGGAGSGSLTVVQEKDESEQDPEKALRCMTCGAAITSERQRISRNGKHRHTFFNPAGIVYEIGCFQEAPGCLVHGAGSREFAWFAEHVWRLAFCRICREHLGWHFSFEQSVFFGLVLNRLRAE